MIEIFDVEQGTEQWHALRLGIPTASHFAEVIRDPGTSKTRRDYMLKLAGERLTGEPMGSFENQHMERGRTLEAEARDLYAFAADIETRQVGFIRNWNAGCSPDSLIGDDGMIEIKTALPHILIDIALKDEFPVAHRAQTQGALWIAEREWIDCVVYWPGLPLFVKRARRIEPFIATLAKAIEDFNNELNEIVERFDRAASGAKADGDGASR
jgi:hypothetical protein